MLPPRTELRLPSTIPPVPNVEDLNPPKKKASSARGLRWHQWLLCNRKTCMRLYFVPPGSYSYIPRKPITHNTTCRVLSSPPSRGRYLQFIPSTSRSVMANDVYFPTHPSYSTLFFRPCVLRQVAWPTDKMREQQGSRMKCVVTVFGLSL